MGVGGVGGVKPPPPQKPQHFIEIYLAHTQSSTIPVLREACMWLC